MKNIKKSPTKTPCNVALQKGITKHKTSLNKADYYLISWNVELENIVLNKQK